MAILFQFFFRKQRFFLFPKIEVLLLLLQLMMLLCWQDKKQIICFSLYIYLVPFSYFRRFVHVNLLFVLKNKISFPIDLSYRWKNNLLKVIREWRHWYCKERTGTTIYAEWRIIKASWMLYIYRSYKCIIMSIHNTYVGYLQCISPI